MKGFGSLPWFCGIFWLIIGSTFHYIARFLFWTNLRTFHPIVSGLVHLANRCFVEAMLCTAEAGL